MVLLDTDTLTLLFQGHARVRSRMEGEEPDVATTIISWIEVLRGRFDAIFKAADSEQLLRAYTRLRKSENQFMSLPIVPIDRAVAAQFERLLHNRKLKSIGRGDLLIASMALARNARLASRNLRDFSRVPGLRIENWAD
jgi:tRNA(fMet)-specific endonuclease VapC